MTHRVHNFGAGPAALPLGVLERAREEMLDFDGSGMSILEASHRGPVYSKVHERALADLRALLGGAADHEILFLAGGARSQFTAVPMNVVRGSTVANYLTTGRWSELALEAAQTLGRARELWSGAENGYARPPTTEATPAER